MYSIKCPKFMKNSNKLRSKLVDKKSRKEQLLKVCCGNYVGCKLCKEA